MSSTEKCSEHSTENALVLCYTCKLTKLCLQCTLKGDHKDHDVINVKDLKDELNKLVSKDSKDDSQLVETLNEVDKCIAENTKSSDTICDEIDKRREFLKREIDNLADDLKRKCRETHQTGEKFLRNRRRNVTTCLGDCEKAIKLSDPVKQAMALKRTKDLIRRQAISKKNKELFFTAGKLSVSGVDKMFGKLGTSDDDLDVGSDFPVCSNVVSEENANGFSSTDEELECGSDFRADRRAKSVRQTSFVSMFSHSKSAGISFICPLLKQEKAWIKCQGEKRIKLVNSTGHTEAEVSFDKGIRGMDLDSNGTPYVASFEDQCIFKITQKGDTYSVSKAFSTNGLMPYHICFMPDDNLLVTLIDEDSYKLKDKSCRQIAKYTKSGKLITSAEFDKDGQRLFVTPDKVRFNSITGDIVVINRTSRDSRHIVVLDKDLRLKFRHLHTGAVIPNSACYSEPNNGPGYKKFVASDIFVDDNGDILMSVPKRRCIYVVNSCGHYKATLGGHSDIPWSLALYRNKTLWIGYKNGTIAIASYRSEIQA